MLQEKKISSKINYDVLKGLNKTTSDHPQKPDIVALQNDLISGPIEVTPVTFASNRWDTAGSVQKLHFTASVKGFMYWFHLLYIKIWHWICACFLHELFILNAIDYSVSWGGGQHGPLAPYTSLLSSFLYIVQPLSCWPSSWSFPLNLPFKMMCASVPFVLWQDQTIWVPLLNNLQQHVILRNFPVCSATLVCISKFVVCVV